MVHFTVVTFDETLCTNLEPVTFGVVGRMSRPVVSPDAFNGEGELQRFGSTTFEGVASLNKWSDEDKLLWLRIRLTGRAQTAYKQLKAEVRGGNLRQHCQGSPSTLRARESAGALRCGVPKPGGRKRRRAGPILETICGALADRAFPDLGNDGKQTNRAATFPGELIEPPGWRLGYARESPRRWRKR